MIYAADATFSGEYRGVGYTSYILSRERSEIASVAENQEILPVKDTPYIPLEMICIAISLLHSSCNPQASDTS